MSNNLNNNVADMWTLKGTTVSCFGKDQTNTVTYTFNQQGFRSSTDFVQTPEHAVFGCSLVMGIGVPENQIVSSYFSNCQNYGLAGRYTNRDILNTVKKFSQSELYTPEVKMAVVWTDRDPHELDDFYRELEDFNIIHFFCGHVLERNHCYKFIKTLDLDASKTHPGPLTHKTFFGILCRLFDR